MFVAAALGRIYTTHSMPPKFWLLAMFCAILPDFDVVALRLGFSWTGMFGHRGFTHSPFFALITGFTVAWLSFRRVKVFSREFNSLWLFFFLCTASHGLLDAMTNGGLGITFYAPFSGERFFLPWTPLEVSTGNPREFLGKWGKKVVYSELIWICLPMLTLMLSVAAFRKWRGSRIPESRRELEQWAIK